MPPNAVLRFPTTDNDSDFVLIQVTSAGKRPLDLKLLGTEGAEPYVLTLRHDRVSTLMVKNAPCEKSEWESILSSLLQQKPLKDIQATATVTSQASITLTVRKRIQSITQRLGSLTLSHDDDQQIELFDWCGTSAEAALRNGEALAAATAKAEELEQSVDTLKKQLDELIKANAQDQKQLLEKFRDLLNEKKVKIRQQQKIIAVANVDPRKLAEIQSSQNVAGHKAEASRKSKRKAPVTADEDESDDGFEKMEVDQPVGVPRPASDDGDDTQSTQTHSEDEEDLDTGDDGKSDDDIATLSKDLPPAADSRQKDATVATESKAHEKPPTPRQLPYSMKKDSQPAAQARAPIFEGSETESDDEL